MINEPIEKGSFPSPELDNMSSLPFKLPSQAGLFSLASLVGTLITSTRLSSLDNDVDKFLFEILHTKLYWCLKKCLNKDPVKRVFVLIV